LKERFLVYIKGGYYQSRYHSGCLDKTEPESLGWMYVPYRLYFAKDSSSWGGGVAFLACEKEPNSEYHAIVRLWKITEEQFECLHKQEGKGWYHKILILGKKDGLTIKTFTGCWMNNINLPSEEYLDVIKKGLKETTGWTDQEIEKYLCKFI